MGRERDIPEHSCVVVGSSTNTRARSRNRVGVGDVAAWHVLKPHGDHDPKQKPNGGHDPPGARVPVEHGAREPDLVQQAADKRADGEPGALADDEPPGQSRPAADADDARVGAVALGVEELCERHARHDAAGEDEVEPVRAVGQGV